MGSIQRRIAIIALAAASALFPRGASAAPQGSDPIVAEFKAAGRAFPEALLKRGYRKFGNLDLKEFLAAMRKVEVVSRTWVARPQVLRPEVKEMGRYSAQWKINSSTGARMIEVNRQMWAEATVSRPGIALHEYLGVLGYKDQDYLVSCVMWTLARPEVYETLESSEIGGLVERAKVALSDGGGSVGIGGGGDTFGLALKMATIYRKLDQIKAAKTTEDRAAFVRDIYATLYEKNERRIDK